ncbi:hypothetical protein BDZ89DRAFT_1148108 [Hymenopellis radicata]|nr:hypothetical protein BDZ89DRAFT_1148108 [Hymenopellis radicata]
MALVHDYFIVINQAQRGAPVSATLSLHFCLLSLYIVEEDVRAFKTVGTERTYQAIEDLLELRERTLFSSQRERRKMCAGHDMLRRTKVTKRMSHTTVANRVPYPDQRHIVFAWPGCPLADELGREQENMQCPQKHSLSFPFKRASTGLD